MNNNISKPGYKHTSLGWIPEDWEYASLENFCLKITDGTHETPKTRDKGIPYLTAIHIKDGFVDYSNCYFLAPEDHFNIYKRCNPEKGDVLMVNIGAGVLSSAYINVDYEFSLKNVALLKPNKKKLEGKFLEIFQNFIKSRFLTKLLVGGAQPFLGLKDIKRLPFFCPPLPEQKAIADILSTWDETISKTQELIKKLEERNKGLMQALLTGKKRLQGFDSKWIETKLGKLGVFQKGAGVSKSEVLEEGFLAVRYGEIYTQHNIEIKRIFSYISLESSKISKKIFPGDILFAGSGETLEDIGKCVTYLFVDEAYAGGDIIIFQPSDQDSLFLSYLLNSEGVVRQKISMGKGHSVVHIYPKDLAEINLMIPESKDEQVSIANILRNADIEIQHLKEKTESLKLQKKGLMRKLLTGEIRVK